METSFYLIVIIPIMMENIKLQIYTIKDCSVKQKEYEQYQGEESRNKSQI